MYLKVVYNNPETGKIETELFTGATRAINFYRECINKVSISLIDKDPDVEIDISDKIKSV